jgi:hypothetical protein
VIKISYRLSSKTLRREPLTISNNLGERRST